MRQVPGRESAPVGIIILLLVIIRVLWATRKIRLGCLGRCGRDSCASVSGAGIIVFSNPLFNAVFHRLFRRRELSTSPGGACCGSAELYYKSSANSVHTFTW